MGLVQRVALACAALSTMAMAPAPEARRAADALMVCIGGMETAQAPLVAYVCSEQALALCLGAEATPARIEACLAADLAAWETLLAEIEPQAAPAGLVLVGGASWRDTAERACAARAATMEPELQPLETAMCLRDAVAARVLGVLRGA